MTAVPTLAGVEAPAGATIVLTPAAMTFTLDSIPADVTGEKSGDVLAQAKLTNE